MRRRLLLVLTVSLALVAAACGSSGGGSDGTASDDEVAATTAGSAAGPLTGATAPPGTLGGSGPLAAAKTFTGLTQNHLDGPIRYRQTPPVGGDHAFAWANCGAYDFAINPPNGVHSMEHGAVWITYRPSLPEAQRKVLRDLVLDQPYLLVSPWTDEALPSPIVLSAWGVQLGVKTASDPAVVAFVDRFAAGPQTPEPGAACIGGLGSPAVQSRAPSS